MTRQGVLQQTAFELIESQGTAKLHSQAALLWWDVGTGLSRVLATTAPRSHQDLQLTLLSNGTWGSTHAAGVSTQPGRGFSARFVQITSSLRTRSDPFVEKAQTFQPSSSTARAISLTTSRLSAF